MLTSKAKVPTIAVTTLGLVTTVTTLWIAAVPCAGAAVVGTGHQNQRSTSGGHSRMQRFGRQIFRIRLG
jgi:hypothetical protein